MHASGRESQHHAELARCLAGKDDAAGSVHAVALETGSCSFGIRWTCDGSAPAAT